MRVHYLGLLPLDLLRVSVVEPCDAAEAPAPENRCPRVPIASVQTEGGAVLWVCLMHGLEAERAGELEMRRTSCRLSWRMSAFQDGEVEEAEAALLRPHLLDCRECQKTLDMGLTLDALASSARERRRSPQQEEDEGGAL